jgi:hypothetical protein
MLHGDVGGRAELRHVQGLLATSGEELKKRLLKETRAALRPTRQEVKASAARLPSGYAPTMARSVRVATRVTAGSGGVRATVRVSARGKMETRDVRSIDAGRLRHPLFGRRRHWYTTTVKPRFASDPLAVMVGRVRHGVWVAANDTADEILRG